jgi:hypothetical protein
MKTEHPCYIFHKPRESRKRTYGTMEKPIKKDYVKEL